MGFLLFCVKLIKTTSHASYNGKMFAEKKIFFVNLPALKLILFTDMVLRAFNCLPGTKIRALRQCLVRIEDLDKADFTTQQRQQH